MIYVDDILVIGNDPAAVQKLISQLNSSFSLKHLGDLDFFLGIEVKRFSDGSLHLSQRKYIRDLLERAGMLNAKGLKSPMSSSCKLTNQGTDYMADPTLYRSIVGALQYVTLTRPELSFPVNKVCQFMSQPLEEHWKTVKRILRYLAGTDQHGLLMKPTFSPAVNIIAFCDADWASDSTDMKSTSGSCIFLGPNIISWWSKKQAKVSRSSAIEVWPILQQNCFGYSLY